MAWLTINMIFRRSCLELIQWTWEIICPFWTTGCSYSTNQIFGGLILALHLDCWQMEKCSMGKSGPSGSGETKSVCHHTNTVSCLHEHISIWYQSIPNQSDFTTNHWSTTERRHVYGIMWRGMQQWWWWTTWRQWAPSVYQSGGSSFKWTKTYEWLYCRQCCICQPPCWRQK